MKKNIVAGCLVMICVVLILFVAQDSFALWGQKAGQQVGKTLVPPKTEKLKEKAMDELHSKAWIVYITAEEVMGRRSGVSKESDILTFSGRKVLSQNLSELGYSKGGSNFSLWVADDGSYVWETMQLNEDGESRAFLRGEVRGGVMKGGIDIQPVKGVRRILGFSSIK